MLTGLWLYLYLFFISLLAELIANDKLILVKYRGEYFFLIANFYLKRLLGDFKTEAVYRDPGSVPYYVRGFRIVLSLQKKLWRQSQMHPLI